MNRDSDRDKTIVDEEVGGRRRYARFCSHNESTAYSCKRTETTTVTLIQNEYGQTKNNAPRMIGRDSQQHSVRKSERRFSIKEQNE